MSDLPVFEFDTEGVLHLRIPLFAGAHEPICPKCNEPIQWCLDMFSFLTLQDGSYRLAHAECAWTAPAFTKVKRRAEAITRKRNREESRV